jgi:hypothetical protein
MHCAILKGGESWVWWPIPAIPALKRHRQDDQELGSSLGYIASSRLAIPNGKTLSGKQIRKERNKGWGSCLTCARTWVCSPVPKKIVVVRKCPLTVPRDPVFSLIPVQLETGDLEIASTLHFLFASNSPHSPLGVLQRENLIWK